MQTAQYDATTGRNAGADVDRHDQRRHQPITTQRLLEYFRNEDLNANDWFTKAVGRRAGFCGRINMVLPPAVQWSGTSF